MDPRCPGNWTAAREAFEQERTNGGDPQAAGWKILEAQLAPPDNESNRDAIKMLETAIADDTVRGNAFAYAFEIALAYLHLGDQPKALDWLERSEKARTHSFNLIEPDPRVANLEKEPRYKKLLEKLHKSR